MHAALTNNYRRVEWVLNCQSSAAKGKNTTTGYKKSSLNENYKRKNETGNWEVGKSVRGRGGVSRLSRLQVSGGDAGRVSTEFSE